MRCEEFQENLSAFLDGEVAPELARAMREHAAGCERCHRAMQWLVRGTEVIASGLPVLEPPPGLWTAISRELQPPARREWFFLRPHVAWATMAAAAALIIVAAGSLWWVNRNAFDERMFQHELSAYVQQRQEVLRHGNPFQAPAQTERPQGVSPDNPFSPYLRPVLKNPFKETE